MRDLVGATVVRCLTEVYVGPSESGDPRNPYCVSLALEDGTLATIEGAKDDESIAITERVPSAADMDEFGEVQLQDSGPVCDTFPRGTVITSAAPMIDSHGRTIRLRIDTSSNTRIFVFNWGDELYALNDLWPAVTAEISLLEP